MSRSKSKSKTPAKSKPKTQAARKTVPVPATPVVVDAGTPAGGGAAPTQEAIAAKAYEIWVAKGRPVGQDEANWADAEAALRA